MFGVGSIFALIIWCVTLFIAYLIIRTAVRHGIESSKTHELLQEIHEKMDRIEK